MNKKPFLPSSDVVGVMVAATPLASVFGMCRPPVEETPAAALVAADETVDVSVRANVTVRKKKTSL